MSAVLRVPRSLADVTFVMPQVGNEVAEVYRAVWRSLVKLLSLPSASRTLTEVVSLPYFNRLRTDDD